MAQIEFEGKNTEDAMAKACASLGLPVEELKFSIITTGSSGIFGLGGRKAKIMVELPPTPEALTPPAVVEPLTRPALPKTKAVEKRTPPAGPARKPAPPETRPPTAPATATATEQDSAPPSLKPAQILNWADLDVSPPPTQAEPGESALEGEPDELTQQSLRVLAEILKLMDFEATLTAVRFSNRVVLNIDCREHGLLIGKKGATLDALQFLLSKMVLRDEEDEVQIIVDIENYRLRRHESIITLAKNMAEKAWRSGRPTVINQLSSPERRIVHLMFKNVPGLRTKSRGDGLFKSLVIVPTGRFNPADREETALHDSLESDRD